jgi:hypothetical protein
VDVAPLVFVRFGLLSRDYQLIVYNLNLDVLIGVDTRQFGANQHGVAFLALFDPERTAPFDITEHLVEP